MVQAEENPFRKARRALAEIEADLEGWSERIDAEKARLCREVLGIGPGDDVGFESRGKAVRMRLEGVSVSFYDDAVSFRLWDTRYRQDGLPGKRQEYFSLRVARGARK